MENENEMKIVIKKKKRKTKNNTPQSNRKRLTKTTVVSIIILTNTVGCLTSWLAGWLVVCTLPKTNFVSHLFFFLIFSFVI